MSQNSLRIHRVLYYNHIFPEYLETPNEMIVHLGDVQKAGVLAGVRPGPRDV